MSQTSLQQSLATVAHETGQLFQNARSNGLMKRGSLFSRTESRRTAGRDDRYLEGPTMSTATNAIDEQRPSTSNGAVGRSNTDPWGVKRHSLFGGRRKAHRKAASRDDVTELIDTRPIFNNADDYYHHLKKQTISQPFNFQHLTHTRRKHVPDLAPVDEQNALKASDENALGQTSPLDKPLPNVPSLISCDQPSLPTIRLPRPAPGPSRSHSQSVDLRHDDRTHPVVHGRPRGASAPVRPGPTPNRHQPQVRPDASPTLPSFGQSVRLSTINPNLGNSIGEKPPVAEQTLHRLPSEVSYRAQQALPQVPQRTSSNRSSTQATSPNKLYRDSTISTNSNGDAFSAPDSRRTSRSTRLTAPSTVEGDGSIPEDSWEEHVDFCYQREAESTCDFDWEAEEETVGGFRLSKFLPPSDDSRTSALFASSNQNTSPLQQRRMSIVGHRGFQHARANSTIYEAPDDETLGPYQTATSVHEDSKSDFVPGMLCIPQPLDTISDTASSASAASSSRQQKTSSCASYDSVLRAASSSYAETLAEVCGGHSSVASLNSIPELVHSSTAESSTEAVPLAASAVATPPVAAAAEGAKQQQLTESDLMRKPSVLSNRAILNACRAVQRGRPATPSRFSSLLPAPVERPVSVAQVAGRQEDSPGGWI